MVSDQRFQRNVQAVAEAVQVFAAGTFDFAESIKQIWGPQAQPDALETSNLLPVEGMQDVQIVGELRERIPVSQDGDQLAIHSHTYPPSVTLHNGEGVSEVSHETTVPVETANMELSNNMDVLAGSIHRSIRSCYECFVRWRDESPFPPCHSITGQQTCNYCLRNQIPCDMVSCTIGTRKCIILRENRFQQARWGRCYSAEERRIFIVQHKMAMSR